MAERRAAIVVDAARVRTAMANGLDHALEHPLGRERSRRQGEVTGDATHRRCQSYEASYDFDDPPR